MIISTDIGKTFDKIQHPFIIKKKKKLLTKYRQNPELPQPDKELLKTPSSCDKRLNAFSLRSRTRQRCPFLALIFKMFPKSLPKNRLEQEIKGVHTKKKEVKLDLLTKDICRKCDSTYKKKST